MLSDRLGLAGADIILMYHRVAELPVDPWGLAVGPANFEAQMGELAEAWNPTGLGALVDGNRRLRNRGRRVAVTFDDGYVDNLEAALPILERFDIPATVFVTTGSIDSDEEFWWDRLERIFLVESQLPEHLPPEVAELIGDDPLLGAVEAGLNESEPSWLAWETARNQRQDVFYRVWKALHQSQPVDRQRHIESLGTWSETDRTARSTHRTLNRKELRELDSHRLIDCQAHSVSHAPLPTLGVDAQLAELRSSRKALESIVGRTVEGFAYPHGAIDGDTGRLAATAGFAYACTTKSGLVRRRADRYELPRCGVNDWSAAEFRQRLDRWWTGGGAN